MDPDKKLMEQAFEILQKKGKTSVEFARQMVFQGHVKYVPLREALFFFMRDWNDVLHPALVSLACEAVGGKAEDTTEIGAALVLLAGGADIHDDIIDQSVMKGSEQTVLGKFGYDIALLAGDALLLKGVYLLHEACEKLNESKKKTILEVLGKVFLEISSAEAAEADMRGRVDMSKSDYLNLIHDKVAAGEAASRIGAVVGEGSSEEIEIMARFGRAYGYLLAIRDEFIDIFEQDELTNRIKKECLPLPILLALGDDSKRSALLELLRGIVTEDKIEKIVDIVTCSEETKQLVSEMKLLVEQITVKLHSLRCCNIELTLLLEAALEDL